MLTKAKAMYQTWLIIEGLSYKERELISKELLDEIQNTMEVDESIKIDFDIPLEKQKLDSKTWSMLEKVMQSAEQNGYERRKGIRKSASHSELMRRVDRPENVRRKAPVVRAEEREGAERQNKDALITLERIKNENVRLTQELQKFKEDSKVLLADYKDAFEKSQEENEKLKQDCESLIETFHKIPGFIRNVFIKDKKVKLLISGE